MFLIAEYRKSQYVQKLVKLCVGIIFLASIILPIFNKLDEEKFSGDENYYLYASSYFKLLFVDRNVHSERWKELAAYGHPQVGSYIVGLALTLTGHPDTSREAVIDYVTNNYWELYWNKDDWRTPPADILYTGRFVIGLFGVSSCLLLYYLGSKLFNVRTGAIASLLLAYNPVFLRHSRRAMGDIPLTFFFIMHVVLLVLFYRSLRHRRRIKTLFWAVFLGINAGLTTGVKLIGITTLVLYALFCLLLILIEFLFFRIASHDRPSVLKRAWMIFFYFCLSCTVATALFIGIYPYVYTDTAQKLVQMFTARNELIAWQQQNIGPALMTISDKAMLVIQRTLLPNNYGRVTTDMFGNIYPENFVVLGNIIKLPIDFALFLLGSIMLVYGELRYFVRHRRISIRSVPILWIVLFFIVITIWIPLDWDRYYLPLLPPIALLISYGIDRVISLIKQQYRNNQT